MHARTHSCHQHHLLIVRASASLLFETERMLRLVGNGIRRPQRLLVVRRHLTETKTTTPRIISRRAWQQHLSKNPPHKQASTSPKAEEKPWPKSLQIAGYTMAFLFIPYSMAWFVASNGSARALLHSPTLDDLLRHHFGEEEFNELSYYDVTQGQEAKYQLDGEPTYRERLQEEEIEALKDSSVKVRVRVDNDNDSFVETALPGATRARSHDVLGELKREGTIVAVDFGNVIDDEMSESELTQDVVISDQSAPVTHETNIYSLWHHQSSQQAQDTTTTRMTSHDVEVSRLEHEIQVLQSDLNDVNCTRDRDDMVRELKEKKSALRSMKWKKRLGFSS